MRIHFLLVTFVWFSTSQASKQCKDLIRQCQSRMAVWTRCYEDESATCTTGRHFSPDFTRVIVNSSQQADVRLVEHRVQIPSSALRMSRGTAPEENVVLVASVINSTHFTLSPSPGQGRARGRGRQLHPPAPRQATVLDGLVLAVRAGNLPVKNLSEPIRLFFKHNKQVNGTCVFWEESQDGTGDWSRVGCSTTINGYEFICSCDHLSFFAVLVNPELSVDKRHAVNLNYITYIGSGLSVIFTFISLIIYTCLHRRRPEKAICVHMQLTGALLCLHLSFLLCCLWVWLHSDNEDSWVCRVLGLLLHWSLLATFSWTALEGFHLYLLLVRVFNIYVRRYLLKLSLVGWGFPTLVAGVCGISGVYGKYILELKDGNNDKLTAEMCWMSSQFPQRLLVSYITTVAFPCLVILYNSCMLGLVVFKLCGLRGGKRGFERGSDWRKTNGEDRSRLWKDCATLLGLSWVLGLPWALASATYISLPGIYTFTIFNSLQGVLVFLWSLALTCKSQSDNNSSVRDPSSQKMMTTSLNN
ncbi:adhesion G protein-coupled receptor G3 [Embiotoca jacksoni]|uniref:adhesion G protein-coupled receptor G3 n=1 Tax=Embiotoca jacksoni TaxID=100190 RepID=UPI0037041FF4